MKQDLEHVWKGLSNPTRRKMLDLLRDGPLTTGELAEGFPDLSRFAVMQHLAVLNRSGLVLVRKEGRKRFNYLNAAPVRMLYERWVSEIAAPVAEAAVGLKRFVERRNEGDRRMEAQADRVVKIEVEIRIEASPERVFVALTRDLDDWWPHRFRPDGKMVMECHVGGRCFEDWGDGRGAHHGVVVWWDPPHKYAAVGPGVMTKEYQSYDVGEVIEDGVGSIYRKSMTLWGNVTPDIERMFRDGSQALQRQYLKAYLEGGVRYSGK